MAKDPFLKAFDELLEDQIDLIRFEKISREYAANEDRKDEIMKTLGFLPATVETKLGPVKIHKLLADLDELHYESVGICFDIAVKRGFSLAYKLIFHNLI
jgi:hypothetical protein